jgi:hypothetical protein
MDSRARGARVRRVDPKLGVTPDAYRANVKPRSLLVHLLAWTVTNVAFYDAQKLLVALGFDALRVGAVTTSTVALVFQSSSTFGTMVGRRTPTSSGNLVAVERRQISHRSRLLRALLRNGWLDHRNAETVSRRKFASRISACEPEGVRHLG